MPQPGIHADDGSQVREPPPKKAGRTANDTTTPGPANYTQPGLTVADVGRFHEFGLSVPQRSFIRASVDEQQPFIVQTLPSKMALVVVGRLTAEKTAERIGLAFEGDIKGASPRASAPR